MNEGETCPAPDVLATANIAANWNFIYDGDGNRVRQEYFEGVFGQDVNVKVTSYFAGGSYELDQSGVVQQNGSILVSEPGIRKYYSFAGQPVAMTNSASEDCTMLCYFITDQLGSVVAMTDSTGTLLSQSRYLPFGQVHTDIGTITQTDLGYTGQRDLDAQGNSLSLGLIDYHARMYDESLQRWTQPDSVISDGNPQSLNRFSYVLNNAINFSDPSGNNACAAYVNGMCVHEVSDADQQLINTFKSTTTSPSSSVVVTTPKTPSKGNGGGEHQCDPDTGKICFSSDYGLCIPTIGCSSYGKNYGNNKGTNNVVCDPGTKTICYSSKHGFCIPTLGCSGPAEDEFDGMGFGFGGSAGIPILQANSAGLEALTFFDTGEDAEYSYGGLSSSSVTAGISGGPYGIILFNTHNTSDYSGQFNVVNLTALMLWECQ